MKIFSRLLTEEKIIFKKLRYTRRPHTAKIHTPFKTQKPGGGVLPYETDGDARRLA